MMKQKPNDDFPWQEPSKAAGGEPDISGPDAPKKRGGIPVGVFVSTLCVVIALTLLLTYTLTVASDRSYYSEILSEQQARISEQEATIALLKQQGNTGELSRLQLLRSLFGAYSYYYNEMDQNAMMTAVLKAYVEATGDHYAEYYTKEEYAAILASNTGDSVGIGISVVQTELTVDGRSYQTYQIISIFENAPAASTELQVGDYIYGIKSDGAYHTVSGLGGYTAALQMLRGTEGTVAEFCAFRKNGDTYETREYSITRRKYESQSVSARFSEKDPTVAVVRITEFNLTTPVQFRDAVLRMKEAGAKHFVFDVRNNPGGDLQSIKAVATYFLQKGDLILSSIDRDGKVGNSYYAEAMTLSGDYAACNVAESEIGMFADLDMVVLCNENTASAAEVFTATLRDYGLAKIVGQKTFGKGIMQSILDLSYFGDYEGYVKFTTYAYVTKCNVTYHEIGISPDSGCEAELSEEAKKYSIYLLPESLDAQLAKAIEQFGN